MLGQEMFTLAKRLGMAVHSANLPEIQFALKRLSWLVVRWCLDMLL